MRVYGDKKVYAPYGVFSSRIWVVNAGYRLGAKAHFSSSFRRCRGYGRVAVDHAEEYGLELSRICSLWGLQERMYDGLYACSALNEALCANSFPGD